MHFIVGLFFITGRAKGVCVCVSSCSYECVLAGLDEHLCVCATFFNNVLSIWALGMAISLTLPKSHNADPLGGRISHQWPAAESPRAPPRRAEITADAIRRRGGIRVGLSRECQHTQT